MKDIYDIKTIAIINPFDSSIFILSFFSSLLITVIFIIFFRVIINYLEYRKRQIFIINLKKTYENKILWLDIENENFFYNINHFIRNFLDEMKTFPWVTKMTKKEILSNNFTIKKLSEIAIICERFEFSKDKVVTENIKKNLINNTLDVIREN